MPLISILHPHAVVEFVALATITGIVTLADNGGVIDAIVDGIAGIDTTVERGTVDTKSNGAETDDG